MRVVGTELGNTPAVARSSYVSPLVIDHFLAGRTLMAFRGRGEPPRHLTVAEHALTRLLSTPMS